MSRIARWSHPSAWARITARHRRTGEVPKLFAVIGSSAGKSRDAIMAIYPRHKAFLDEFVARGEVVGVSPFLDAAGGNMALFRTRAAQPVQLHGPYVAEPSVGDKPA